MEDNRIDGTAINSFYFVFRRPWLTFFTFLIVFNAFHAYSTTIPPIYKTKAVLLFETVSGGGSKKNIVNEKKDAAERIVAGPNIGIVLDEILKDAAPEEKAKLSGRIKALLLDNKKGLRFLWEPKGTGYLLTMDFSFSNPLYCYRAVKATMDMIISRSEQKITTPLEKNILFLKSQKDFYKSKIDSIDDEIRDIRSKLKDRYSELSDSEKRLISESLEKKDGLTGIAPRALEDDLAEMRARREGLQASLDNGTFADQSVLEDLREDDMLSAEHKKTIAAKTMEIDSLLARGYKTQHPHVKKLIDEVEREEVIRRQRIERMGARGPGTPVYEEAMAKVKLEISELDIKIGLMDKSAKGREEGEPAAKPKHADHAESVNDLISRLNSLGSERSANDLYYIEMSKSLVDAEAIKYRSDSEDAGFQISVVQNPEIPLSPDYSKPRDILLRGFFVALFFSAGMAYLGFMLRDAVHFDHEITSMLGIPIIATIDSIETKSGIAARRRRLKYALIATVAIIVVSRVAAAIIFSKSAR